MHPQLVWLFKKLKKMREQDRAKGLTTDDIEKFCKLVSNKPHAICMLGALFDISHTNTPLGDIVRDIDRVAVQHTTSRPIFKKYDRMLVDALDSGVHSSLYKICEGYKAQYNQRLPDLETTDFDSFKVDVNNFRKPQIFDPANLFQGA